VRAAPPERASASTFAFCDLIEQGPDGEGGFVVLAIKVMEFVEICR
jgi:hypothetical protein